VAVANMVRAVLARGGDPPEPPAPEIAGSEGARLRRVPPPQLLAAAVAAATRIPADLIGRPDLGRLAPGAAADLAWLDDDLRTAATWIEGEKVYP
jgi:cytosine/adenosine deaminase-related metal-dependent hydrolase